MATDVYDSFEERTAGLGGPKIPKDIHTDPVSGQPLSVIYGGMSFKSGGTFPKVSELSPLPASPPSDIISFGGKFYPIIRASIDLSSSGEIAAPEETDGKILLLGIILTCSATTVKFRSKEMSGPTYTDLSGSMSLSEGLVLPINHFGYYLTAANEPLDLLIGAAVSGSLVYAEVGY